MHKEHETVIETVLAWLAGWWPLLALPGAFAVGSGAGWLFGREERLHLQRELKRRAADYTELAIESAEYVKASNSMVTKLNTYDRDWQALRAIVEQHTVKT